MRNALELYEGVLRELDRYGAPNLEVHDFNYFYEKATDLYLSEALKLYDLTDDVSDSLSALVVNKEIDVNVTDETSENEVELPEDYRRLGSCIAVIRVINDYGLFKKNNRLVLAAKRLTADSYAYVMNNSYMRPVIADYARRVYRRLKDNSIEILYDTPDKPNPNVVLESIKIEYIRNPKKVDLSEDYESIQGSELPDYIDDKIISICASLVRTRDREAAGSNQQL